MAVLFIENIEKQNKDTILFSAINLTMNSGDIVAIHSNLNVRKALLDLFTGHTSLHKGKLEINGCTIESNKSTYFSQVAICFFNEGLYERLTVLDHFKFYQSLYRSDHSLEYILNVTQLHEVKYKKVKRLSFSEKKRIQFARMLFHSPPLFIFEEPDLNIDVETKRIFLNITRKLQEEGKSVLILTGNMESALTATDDVYRLDETGLHTIETASKEENMEAAASEEEKEVPSFQFSKIPAKVNEKIILFDPSEIDYIESHAGQSNVCLNGEFFPTAFTLAELERKLKPEGFFRCHRSYIVNLQKVKEVITWTRNSFSLILNDRSKSSIPLSKTKMTELKEMLDLK